MKAVFVIKNPSSSLGMGLASNRVGISYRKTNLSEASKRLLCPTNSKCGCKKYLSVQGTTLYAQKYVLAWETVPMVNEC